jgi:hypothetical protein
MDRDAITAELVEIEGMLQDERLKDKDQHALHGAQQPCGMCLMAKRGSRLCKRSTGSTATLLLVH